MAWINRVRLDRTAVRAFLSDPIGPVARFIDNLTGKAATVARAEVHVRTGETLSSIDTQTHMGTTEQAIRVGEVSASYAVFFLEKGVKPHFISPHGDYNLRNLAEARNPDGYLGSWVLHPGFAPMPFLTTGLWSLQDDV